MNPHSKIPDERDSGRERLSRPITEAEREALHAQHWDWLKFIAVSAIEGAVLGALVAIAIIYLNYNGIGDMLANSRHSVGYTALLIFGFAYTFAMVVSGTAIWIRATRGGED